MFGRKGKALRGVRPIGICGICTTTRYSSSAASACFASTEGSRVFLGNEAARENSAGGALSAGCYVSISGLVFRVSERHAGLYRG